MTKKERQPQGNREERETPKKGMNYNPDITPHDKEILNNQSLDEEKGEYLDEREEPIDFTADDLDIPEMDEKQFNETASKPDESEREKRPKESANTKDDPKSDSETIYKGEKAEEYQDPSQKSRESKNGKNG